jgi:hypothetical protein
VPLKNEFYMEDESFGLFTHGLIGGILYEVWINIGGNVEGFK